MDKKTSRVTITDGDDVMISVAVPFDTALTLAALVLNEVYKPEAPSSAPQPAEPADLAKITDGPGLTVSEPITVSEPADLAEKMNGASQYRITPAGFRHRRSLGDAPLPGSRLFEAVRLALANGGAITSTMLKDKGHRPPSVSFSNQNWENYPHLRWTKHSLGGYETLYQLETPFKAIAAMTKSMISDGVPEEEAKKAADR